MIDPDEIESGTGELELGTVVEAEEPLASGGGAELLSPDCVPEGRSELVVSSGSSELNGRQTSSRRRASYLRVYEVIEVYFPI
jgi:hypothetical protein